MGLGGVQQQNLGNRPGEALPESQDLTKTGIAEQLAGDEESGKETAKEALRKLSPIRISVVQSQNRLLVRTRDVEALQQVKDLIDKLDVQASSVLLEVKALKVDLSDGLDSVFNFEAGSISKDVSLGAKIAPGRQLTDADSMLVLNVNNQFNARIRVLEKKGRVTSIATPMLLTTNHEVSRVFVGDERPIITGYTSSTNSATGGVGNIVQVRLVPQTEKRPVGTTLLLTPTINSDRTVNIRLIVEQSTIGTQANIPVDNGLGDIVNVPIDIVSARTFSGTVLTKDKTTVAVGGLIEEGWTDQYSKIPLLGDIPLLGSLFSDTSKTRTRTELIILIKPHVMVTPAESAERSRELLRDHSLHPESMRDEGFRIYGKEKGESGDYQVLPPYETLRP
jgi:general secretion pathway protein D